jgi:hypothetical protein
VRYGGLRQPIAETTGRDRDDERNMDESTQCKASGIRAFVRYRTLPRTLF